MDNQKPDTIKAASLTFNSEGDLLIVKPKGRGSWISLGGKQETGETLEECLAREIEEELQVKAVGEPKFYYGTGAIPTADQELNADGSRKTVDIQFYFIDIEGEPQPDGVEIESFMWLSREDFEEKVLGDGSLKIGSGLQNIAIPRLIEDGVFNYKGEGERPRIQ